MIQSLTVSTIWHLDPYFLSDKPATIIVLQFLTKNPVKIFKSTEVNITALCPPIIQGHRNAPSQPLYSVSLTTHPPSIHKSNATMNISSIQDRISFYHSALLSPKRSTWCKAIKNGFLQSWPELTVNQMTKYIFQFLKPHSKAQFMNRDPTFIQPKMPLLTKIWTLPFQHPVPLISSQTKKE